MPRLSSAAFVAATLLAACSDAPSGTTTDVRRLLPLSSGLELGIAVSPARIQVGDSARVTVTLTNRTDAPVTLHFGSGCQLHYEVTTLAGDPVPPQGGGYMCTAALTTLSLEPGETETQHFRWTHTRYDYPPYTRAYQGRGVLRFRPVLLTTADGVTGHAVADLAVDDTTTYGAKPLVGIGVAAARSPVRAGDTVTVRVTLRNLDRRPVSMRFTSTCQVRVRLSTGWGANETVVSSVGEACGDALTSLTLAAGETRVVPGLWRAVDARRAPLPPGGLTIRASLGAHAPERRLDAPLAFMRVDP